MSKTITQLLLFIALLTACADPVASVESTSILTGATSTEPAIATLPPPTLTFTPEPSPTATPEPHPLTITAMRDREYPGSEVTIEQPLAPGSNYSRYLASYYSEGLKIYALLTVPNGQRPETGWPVIIFNHGYIPPAQYVTTERYVAYVDLIARSGYIVFRSDYRGHGNSEGEARGGYGYPDYTVDVLNATAAMKAFPEADPNRIGMWGHSMGGYITLRSMVIDPDIKAGVIWAGVVASYPDLLYNWRRTTSIFATPIPASWRGWRVNLIETYGTPEENPAFWDSISTNSYLHEISGPVQLHHGTADEDVPVEFSTMTYAQLLSASQVAELYTYEGDNHNISNYFSSAMMRTVAFFDKYVKNAAP